MAGLCELSNRDLYVGTEWDDGDDDETEEEYQRRIPHDVLHTAQGYPIGALGRFSSFSAIADLGGPSPEEATRVAFLARPPAMGLSAGAIARLRDCFDRGDAVCTRDTNRVFRLLRARLLRQCVPCDGAATITALADALDAERAAGVAAPMPTWFTFASGSGPRRLGLRECCTPGCFRVEGAALRMKRCAGCEVPSYCSKAGLQVDSVKTRALDSAYGSLLCYAECPPRVGAKERESVP